MNLPIVTTLHEQVTPEFLTAVDAAITALEQASGFAISLTNLDRRRLRAFSSSNESFVPDVIEAAAAHADLVAPRCNAAEIGARHRAAVALRQRVTRLQEVTGRLSDTGRVAADGSVALSLEAYQGFKRVAESAGIEPTVDRLARRFEANAAAARRQTAPQATDAGTDAPASGASAPAAGTASPAPSGGSASGNAAGPNVVPLPAAAAPMAQAA